MSLLRSMGPGYVYAVTFSNGLLKVGGSQNIAQRLSSVKSFGRRYGGEPTSSIAFAHQHVSIGEAVSRRFAVQSGGVAIEGHREWLTGVRPLEFLQRVSDFWPDALSCESTRFWVNPKLPGLRGAYIFDRSEIERLAKERVA